MKAVKGRDDFLASAVLAADEKGAMFHRHLAQMMAAYTKQESLRKCR